MKVLADDSRVHTVAVVGGGSAGVHQSHLGEIGKNTFATLTFGTHEITVSTFSVHAVNPSERIWLDHATLGAREVMRWSAC